MAESDGINEVFAGATRVGLTAAGLIAERLLRAREQAQRDAQARSEQEARELQVRLDAERSAARAQLAVLERDEWWQTAQPDDLALAWETAKTWEEIDPDARHAVERMREQLRDRYAVDVDELGADPAAVQEALARREEDLRRAAHERARAELADQEAALLLVGAERADRDREPGGAAAQRAGADVAYDSAERRRDLAARLQAAADEEAVEARVVADVSEAEPPQAAVAKVPRSAPAARRARGSGASRAPRRSDRGR